VRENCDKKMKKREDVGMVARVSYSKPKQTGSWKSSKETGWILGRTGGGWIWFRNVSNGASCVWSTCCPNQSVASVRFPRVPFNGTINKLHSETSLSRIINKAAIKMRCDSSCNNKKNFLLYTQV
jgi:hypothetical protein